MSNAAPYSPGFMAGQRLMLGFDGLEMNQSLETVIRDFKAGGIILFRQNIDSPDQLRQLCTDAQDFARSLGQPPLFIAVDQEGGSVARLRKPWTEFPGNDHIQTMEEAEHFAQVTANELGQAGINMDLAPVLDMTHGNPDSIMKARAFPGDETQVSNLGCKVITTLQNKGIMAVAKHFPGIGRTILDSHFTLPVLDMALDALETSDMVPFKAAMENKVCGVMLSHIFFPQLDKTWQASLSPAIARDLLRNKLGYTGLTLTDDLDMKAISHDIQTCVCQILKAEIDLTLICHTGPDMAAAFEEMTALIQSDANLRSRSQASLQRILDTKAAYLGTFG